jgi:hypothetical protein
MPLLSKAAIPLVIATLFCSLLLAAPLSVHASGTIVQQNSAYVEDNNAPTIAFASPVTSGNVIVVAIDVENYVVNNIASVTDTLGTSYTEPAASPSIWAASAGSAYIFYGTASSSGSDTVTIHMSAGAFGDNDIFAYEVSGITTVGATAGAGTSNAGQTASLTTASTAFTSEGFLIMTTQTLRVDTCTAGAGFTCAAEPEGDSFGLTEVSTSGVSSPTTFPMTISQPDQWDAVGVAFNSGGAPAPNPAPLPAVIPKQLTFHFNFPNAPTLVGKLVSAWGIGVMYNVPGYSVATDINPYAVSICYLPSQNGMQVSGFFSTTPGNNSTEIFVSYYYSTVSSAQGWPTEPTCTS